MFEDNLTKKKNSKKVCLASLGFKAYKRNFKKKTKVKLFSEVLVKIFWCTSPHCRVGVLHFMITL